jgi:hypothetical protein
MVNLGKYSQKENKWLLKVKVKCGIDNGKEVKGNEQKNAIV